jgi:hypothetical protein
MWRTATTIVVVRHIKSLFVFVYVVFIFPRFLAIRCESYHRQYILQRFRPLFLTHNSIKCKQILASKHMIIGATSSYNGMIFHMARRYNAIL